MNLCMCVWLLCVYVCMDGMYVCSVHNACYVCMFCRDVMYASVHVCMYGMCVRMRVMCIMSAICIGYVWHVLLCRLCT